MLNHCRTIPVTPKHRGETRRQTLTYSCCHIQILKLQTGCHMNVDQSNVSVRSHDFWPMKCLSGVTWLLTNQISATHCMHGCVRRQQLANRGIITHVVNLSLTKPPYKHKTNRRHHTETKQGFTEQWPHAASSLHVPRLKIWAALIYTYHTAAGLSANTGPHWLLISERIPTLRCSFLVQLQVNNEQHV